MKCTIIDDDSVKPPAASYMRRKYYIDNQP